MKFLEGILKIYQYIYYRGYLNYLRVDGTTPGMANYSMGYSLPLTNFYMLAGFNKLISSYLNIPHFIDSTTGFITAAIVIGAFAAFVIINTDQDKLEAKFGQGRKNKFQWKLRGALVVGYYIVFAILALYFIYG